MSLRRAFAAASAAALAGGVIAAASAVAATTPCWDDAYTDVDGGGPDVVVGLPSYDLPGKPDAGAIVVFSNVGAEGSSDPKKPTARTLLTAGDFDGLQAQSGARFGAAISVWQDALLTDDPDACADLVVGAPGQTVAGQVGAGQVYLLGGSTGGLGAVKHIYDEAMAGAGGPQPGDGFGSALAVSTGSTMAVGVPGRDVGELTDTGRVIRLNWSGADENPEVAILDQSGNDDVDGEAGDRFGEVLDLLSTWNGDYLVVGVPHEDVGAVTDAGAVELFSPTGDAQSMVTQNMRGAGGKIEAGDVFGSSVGHWWTFLEDQGPTARLAIGVPGEDVGSVKDGGSVAFASWTLPEVPEAPMPSLKGMSEVQTQNSPGIPGKVEAGDRYGTRVLTGEFGADGGREHLLVGAPYEDLDGGKDAGQLSQTRFETDASPSTGSDAVSWTQDSAGTLGKPEAGDRFGARFSSVELSAIEDDDDLTWPVVLVTVPREDVGSTTDAGMAYLGYAPGKVAVALKLPVAQVGAGMGMVPMQVYLGN